MRERNILFASSFVVKHVIATVILCFVTALTTAPAHAIASDSHGPTSWQHAHDSDARAADTSGSSPAIASPEHTDSGHVSTVCYVVLAAIFPSQQGLIVV